MGVDPARVVEAKLFRWRLWPGGHWDYALGLVPGNGPLRAPGPPGALRAKELKVLGAEGAAEEIRRVTGFDPRALPPVVLPAVVDERLLRGSGPDQGEIYVCGTTLRGLYRWAYRRAGDPAPRGRTA